MGVVTCMNRISFTGPFETPPWAFLSQSDTAATYNTAPAIAISTGPKPNVPVPEQTKALSTFHSILHLACYIRQRHAATIYRLHIDTIQHLSGNAVHVQC